jgi:hypothetical protein
LKHPDGISLTTTDLIEDSNNKTDYSAKKSSFPAGVHPHSVHPRYRESNTLLEVNYQPIKPIDLAKYLQ